MSTHFGLDIGSDSIKMVEIEGRKDNFQLLTLGTIKTTGMGMSSDSERDLVAVAEAIRRLKKEIKVSTNNVVASVPDRNIFSHLIEIPKMGKDELNQAIPWEAENIIPHPLSEVNLDWEVIEDDELASQNKMKVLLVAAPKALVSKYLKVLKLAELEPIALESEFLSTIRCLKNAVANNDLMVANLGLKSLDLVLVRKGSLILTRSLPTGGEALTRALSTTLSMEQAAAEEYKKTYGLSNQLEGKVASALEPILRVLENEIKKAAHFYEEKTNETLKLLIITGGSALLPGLAEYFTQSLNLEVQIANPLALVKGDEKVKETFRTIAPLFVVSMGLAMKEI
jgi:type IV pilus assembly protein PilM